MSEAKYGKDYFKYAHRVYAKQWLKEFTEDAYKCASFHPEETTFSREISAHKFTIEFIKFLMDHQFHDLKVTIKDMEEDREYEGSYFTATFEIDWS
jgi:hypothetical protein